MNEQRRGIRRWRESEEKRKGRERVRTLLGANLEFLDLHEARKNVLIRVVFAFCFYARAGGLLSGEAEANREEYGRRLCARGDDLAVGFGGQRRRRTK